MRRVEAIVAAALALGMSSCVVGNKPQPVAAAAPAPPKPAPAPAAPAPPPPPLSESQTQVQLPPAQPLTNEALATTIPPEETASKPIPPKQAPSRRGAGGPVANARPESAAPIGPSASAPAAPAESEPRPQIRDIVPASELKRLQLEAVRMRQEIDQKLKPFGKRHLNTKDQDLKDQALSYAKRSNDAERQGDVRLAYDYAKAGLVVARALADGR